MRNRERIIVTALGLFNEQGTAAISTNHIAAACGISPGNLYYHFRNKEEIIRELFERLFAAWDSGYNVPADRPPTLDDLQQLVRTSFVLLWENRFIYRELIALLRRDEHLQRRWVEVRARGFAGFRELVDYFAGAGVLRMPADEGEIARLTELCWLVSEFWPASVEVSGHPLDAVQVERGVALMLQVIQPYISHQENA